MKQVIDLLCLTDFLDHPWLMPFFVIGVKEVFYSSSYHFFLYIVSQSGGILFLFPFPLFKTKEMLFSVSHVVRYVKKDKLFKVLEEPFKNHPRCEKLVIKAWWPKHVVQRKGNESLIWDLSLGEMDIEESQSFSNSFEKLWEDSNEQNVLQYMLGK